MAEKVLIQPGQPVRLLFSLTHPSGRQTTAEFFATRSLTVQVPPAPDRLAATVRVAPYVVGSFGEALIVLQSPVALGAGDAVIIREGERVVADALVAEIPNQENPTGSTR